MGFLNPLMLWGLLGVSVPVLAHLLNLQRFRRTRWAAMRFLARAAQVRSRQIRLKDILLMLLRCLAVALVVLTLSRPVIRTGGAAAAIGHDRPGVVIALDASYSMLHKALERTRFDRALDRAREIAGTIDEGDPVSLVLVGAQHRVLLRNVPFHRERFEDELATLSPLAEHAALETLPEAVEPLLEQMTVAQKEVYFITDAQARDWAELSDEDYARFRHLAESAQLSVVPVRPGSEENMAITDFRLISGALRKGKMVRYTAEVRNFGTEPRNHVHVVCTVNGDPVEQQTIDQLAPGEARSVPLFARPSDVGRLRLRAELSSDQLALDNTRYVAANVRERIAVLSVDGNPSGKRFTGADDFLVAALTPSHGGNASQEIMVDSLPWNALSNVQFDPYDVVMLADVAELPELLAVRLKQYVNAGGGLVVFVGPNTRLDLWNERFGPQGVDLLAAHIEEPAEEPFGGHDGWPLDAALTDNELVGPLQGLAEDLLGDIRFWRYMRVRPVADAEVVLRIAPEGDPLVVERRIGRGRSILVASTANRDWHNMVINPVFPLLVQQMVASLTRPDLEIPVPVGRPLVVALDDMKVGAQVTFVEPTGQATVSRTIARQGRTVAVFEQTDEVGFHEIECEVASPSFVVAVNPRIGESDVRVLQGESLDAVARSGGMRVMRGETFLAGEIRESRIGRELWLPLLILAAVAMVAEMLLAHQMTRRRAAAGKGGAGS
jgi:hypothetical protein